MAARTLSAENCTIAAARRQRRTPRSPSITCGALPVPMRYRDAACMARVAELFGRSYVTVACRHRLSRSPEGISFPLLPHVARHCRHLSDRRCCAAALQQNQEYPEPRYPSDRNEANEILSKEAAMNRAKTITMCLALVGGITLAISASNPASAQFACPPGYYYVPGYGCELPNSAYALPEYGYGVPLVAPFYSYGGTWDHRRDRDGGYHRGGDFGHGDPGHDFGHARR